MIEVFNQAVFLSLALLFDIVDGREMWTVVFDHVHISKNFA